MSIHIKKRGGKKIWYVHWYDEKGGRHTKTFGPGSANEKLAKAYDLELKAAKKKKVSTTPNQGCGVMFDDLAQTYLNHCAMNGRTKRYVKELAAMMNNRWLEKLCKKPVDEMTYSDDILSFLDLYRDRSQSTRNRYLGYLKAVFNFGVRQGITKVNPLATWRKSREVPRRVSLTVEDLFKIHEYAQPHLKWIIEIVWNTGVRPGPKELFEMKWDDIDLERGIIRVLGKGDLYREIPMSASFIERMREMRAAATTPYVIEYEGRPIKKIRRSLPTAVRNAGITYPVCLYSIRHLFATVTLSMGADLAAVSKILGHCSTKMTADTYYHLLEGEKVRAVGLIPQIGV